MGSMPPFDPIAHTLATVGIYLMASFTLWTGSEKRD